MLFFHLLVVTPTLFCLSCFYVRGHRFEYFINPSHLPLDKVEMMELKKQMIFFIFFVRPVPLVSVYSWIIKELVLFGEKIFFQGFRPSFFFNFFLQIWMKDIRFQEKGLDFLFLSNKQFLKTSKVSSKSFELEILKIFGFHESIIIKPNTMVLISRRRVFAYIWPN